MGLRGKISHKGLKKTQKTEFHEWEIKRSEIGFSDWNTF